MKNHPKYFYLFEKMKKYFFKNKRFKKNQMIKLYI